MKVLGWLVLLGLFSLQAAWAGDSGNGFYIQPADKDVDIGTVSSKPVTILPPPTHAYHSVLPPIQVREKVFAESGLTKSISQLDDFYRDSIYLRLLSPGERPIEKITEKFSRLRGHEQELRIAQKLIQERAKQTHE